MVAPQGRFVKIDEGCNVCSKYHDTIAFIIIVVAPVTLFNIAMGGSISVLLLAFSIALTPLATVFILWDYCRRGEMHYFLMLAVLCLLLGTGLSLSSQY